MNTKQLQYAVALSESLNFSAVAQQLGISQPALSKQILNLENELGVKLFDRSTTPLTLTPAGQHFLLKAQSLLYQEDQLLRSMEDFKSGKNGTLTIGVSPFRSLYMMPPLVRKLKEKFPGVRVVLHELGSDLLRKGTLEGKFDFAIVNLPVDESVLDVTLLEPDVLVLAVPKKHAGTLPTPQGQDLQSIDFERCSALPFVAVGPNQEMRQLFDKTCAAAGFCPNIAMEVVGLSTAWAMCRAGIGATLLPLQFIRSVGYDGEVSLYSLNHVLYSRQPAIISRRGQYKSEYAQYAIQCLTTGRP